MSVLNYKVSKSSDVDFDCTTQSQSESEIEFQNSREYAKNVINRSKENVHNPTESLHMLSCGVEALKSPTSAASAILYVLHGFIINALATSKYLQSLSGRFNGKKIPEEHSSEDFIISNSVEGKQYEKESDCCDGEGDTKTGDKSVKSGKATQNTSTASTAESSSLSLTATDLRFHGNSSGGGGDDEDEDDNQRRRKVRSQCNGNYSSFDEDDSEEGEKGKPVENDDPASTTENDSLDDCHQQGERSGNEPVKSVDDLASTTENDALDDGHQEGERSGNEPAVKSVDDLASTTENDALDDDHQQGERSVNEPVKSVDDLASTTENDSLDGDHQQGERSGNEPDKSEDDLASTTENDALDDLASTTENGSLDDGHQQGERSGNEPVKIVDDLASTTENGSLDDGHQQGERSGNEPDKSEDDLASTTENDNVLYAYSINTHASCKKHCSNVISGKKLSEWEMMLRAAFQCKTERHGVIERCREYVCYAMHVLFKHSQSCKYRVLGGCEKCIDLHDVYVYHAKQCSDRKCPIARCTQIKQHLQDQGDKSLADWRYQDDKVFFGECFQAESVTEAVSLYQNEHQITTDEITEFIKDTCISLQNYSMNSTAHLTGHEIQKQCFWDQIEPRPPEAQDLHVASQIQSQEGSVVSTVSRGATAKYACIAEGNSEKGPKRPEVDFVLHALDESFLSLQDGRYDEGFEWRKVHEDESYLGQGSFGKCYLCIDMYTNKLFAIKKIPITKYDPNELSVWSSVAGENVRCLDLFGAVQVDNSVIVFMEYMEAGSVGQILCDMERLDETSALYILKEVLESLEFLHSRCIIHGDVKGENVFVNATWTKVKLGDYGSAIQLSSLDCAYEGRLSGTEWFMAPEVCRGEQHSFSADIWSAGGLLIQMLTGEPPWYRFSGSVLYKVGTLVETPPLPDCSDATRELMTSMFALVPSQRPSAKELLRHQVFSEVTGPPELEQYLDQDLQWDEPGQDTEQSLDHQEQLHVPLGVQDVNNLAISPFVNGELEDDVELQKFESEFLLSLSLHGPFDMASGIDTKEDVEEDCASEDSYQELLHQVSDQEDSPGLALGSQYSIKDLTKVEFYSVEGDAILEVREKCSCTFGRLAEKLHSEFKDRDASLEYFTFQSTSIATMDADQHIGLSNLHIKVYPAGEENWDEKWPWRISSQGLIQLRV